MKPVTDPRLLQQLDGGGPQPVTDPAILEQLEGNEKGFFRGAMDAIKGAVRGDAAEDLPNVNEAGMSSFKTGLASMFGDDADYANALARQGYQIEQDANGNPIAVDPKTGQRAYVNQPGLDLEDITRGVGKVLSFVPAAKAAALPVTLGGRAVAAGGAAAATDIAMQKASGRDEIDPEQTGLTAIFGGVAELGAPILSAISKRIPWKKQPTAAEGRAIMRELGIDDAGVTDDIAARYAATIRGRVREGVRPESVVADVEFGFKPDPSQQLDDAWRARDVAREASPAARSAQNEQAESVMQTGRDLVNRISPNPNPGVSAMDSVARESSRRLGLADDAYRAAGQMDGAVQGQAFDGLFQRINQFADKKFLRGPHNAPVYPSSTAILGNMDDLTRQIQQFRANPNVRGFDAPFEAVENFRQAIVAATQNAKGADLRAAKGLMKEFDGWMDDVFDQKLISGSDDFLAQVKDARRLWAEYKRDFGERWLKTGTDSFGKKLEQFANQDGSLDAEGMANFVLGVNNNVNRANAKQFAERMKGVMPEEGWNDFRAALVEKLLTNTKTGDSLAMTGRGNDPYRAMINSLKNALQGSNKDLFEIALTSEERSLASRFLMALEGLSPTSQASRGMAATSGTAERVLGQMMERMGGTWGLRIIPEMLKGGSNARYAYPELMQITPKPATAFGASLPAQY